MDELERARQDLADAMEEWRRNGTLSDESLQKLTRAQKTLTDATEDNTEATEEATKNLKKFYKGTKEVLSGLGSTAQGLRENRENFEALNPAIRSTGAIITSGGKAIGGGLAELGEKIAIGGAAFMNPFVVLAGAGVNLVGKAFEGLSEEVAKAGVAFMEFSTGELNRVTGAYRQLGSVGAITAGGMDELYASSIQAGLSVSQFAGLVAQNSKGLAFATGSATESARAIAEITSAARPFQDQLLALGFGLEQQSEVFSEYIVMSRRLGRQQTRDYATLAEGAAEYAFELDELSRLTGMSRQEAQKALEAQMSNVRFRATLAKAEAAGGDTLVKAIRGTAAGVEAFGGRKLAEGFQDAFGGLGTESARQFEIATGGLGRQIVEDLRSNRITQDQALQQIQQSIQGRLTSLGGMDFIERVGKIGTVMDPMLLEMIEFSQRAGVTAEDMGKLRQEQVQARKAQGENTKGVIAALQSMQSVAMSMDQIVKDQVFPNASAAVKTFTGVLEASIKTVAKLLPGSEVQPRAEGGPVDKNKPYLVGEEGPELFSPNQAGAIIDKDKTEKYIASRQEYVKEMIAKLFSDPTLLQEGFETAVGETVSLVQGGTGGISIAGAEGTSVYDSQGNFVKHMATVIDGLTQTLKADGSQSVKYQLGAGAVTKNFDPTGQLTSEQMAYSANGKRLMTDTDYTGMAGPKTSYHGTVDVDGITKEIGHGTLGADEHKAGGGLETQKLTELMEQMSKYMQNIDANTRAGADTSKQMLRVASS